MIQINHLKTFIQFAAKELNLPSLPNIHFVGSSHDKKRSFGHSIGRDITVRITNRHPVDVMRTIVHEMIHFKQNLKGKTGEQFREDQANALAGRIMRKFGTTNPSIFKDQPIPSNVTEEESAVPANCAGSGAIAGIGIGPQGEPGKKKKKLVDIIGPLKRLK